jgi:nicotinamidase-related amidase
MENFTLAREKTGLLIIDVQERLFNLMERPCEVLHALQQVTKGFQIMKLPIFVTEQYPEGLGSTIGVLKSCLDDQQQYLAKTSFSSLGNNEIRDKILSLPIDQWVLVGIEAHICVLQTAKSLLAAGKQVVVLNDAISSRSIYNFSTAIAELRDAGARISCVESVLFELLQDSLTPEFKQISQLVK